MIRDSSARLAELPGSDQAVDGPLPDRTITTLAAARDGLDYAASTSFGQTPGERTVLYFTNAGFIFGTPVSKRSTLVFAAYRCYSLLGIVALPLTHRQTLVRRNDRFLVFDRRQMGWRG